MRRQILLIFFSALAVLSANAATVLDARNFGADAGARRLATAAIQKAIDAAGAAGGGVVVLSGGTFLSGTLELKSRVTLRIEKGARLLGSPHREDYARPPWAGLIEARNQEDIAIEGDGVIDGQGSLLASDVRRMAAQLHDPLEFDRPSELNRPVLIALAQCRGVRLQNITLKDSSCWVQRYDSCDHVVIDHVKVRSTAFWNNDGIDLVDCANARVTDCDIDAADDGICLKSEHPRLSCENIRIERCRVRSSASALKLGTASLGGFRNIRVRDLYVYDTFRSAVALESVDGGTLENVDIARVNAVNTGNALFIRLGHRNAAGPIGRLENVTISDLAAEVPLGRPDEGYAFEGPAVTEPHNLIPSSITGLPRHPVRNVTLKRIVITFGGGATRGRARVAQDALGGVPERADQYPEFSMFGELPAWGFYCRHAEGIAFQDVTVRYKAPDFRPAFVGDDIEDLQLKRVRVLSGEQGPAIVLNHVLGGAVLDSSGPSGSAETVQAVGCRGITHRQ